MIVIPERAMVGAEKSDLDDKNGKLPIRIMIACSLSHDAFSTVEVWSRTIRVVQEEAAESLEHHDDKFPVTLKPVPMLVLERRGTNHYWIATEHREYCELTTSPKDLAIGMRKAVAEATVIVLVGENSNDLIAQAEAAGTMVLKIVQGDKLEVEYTPATRMFSDSYVLRAITAYGAGLHEDIRDTDGATDEEDEEAVVVRIGLMAKRSTFFRSIVRAHRRTLYARAIMALVEHVRCVGRYTRTKTLWTSSVDIQSAHLCVETIMQEPVLWTAWIDMCPDANPNIKMLLGVRRVVIPLYSSEERHAAANELASALKGMFYEHSGSHRLIRAAVIAMSETFVLTSKNPRIAMSEDFTVPTVVTPTSDIGTVFRALFDWCACAVSGYLED